jgi:ACT domain-containing protein
MSGGIFLNTAPHYLLVESGVLPEVFLKVIEAKRYLVTGQARSVNEAARLAGLSRSAYYKYKDSVHPYNEETGGSILTLHAMLRDEAGVLSKLTGLLYREGANIMTINQSIPVGGIAPVTVTARADGMRLSVCALLDRVREIDGVNSIEVLSGL